MDYNPYTDGNQGRLIPSFFILLYRVEGGNCSSVAAPFGPPYFPVGRFECFQDIEAFKFSHWHDFAVWRNRRATVYETDVRNFNLRILTHDDGSVYRML